jgi:hypothetical protein
MRNFITCTPRKNVLKNEQVKEDEIGGACTTNGGEEEWI